MNVGECETRNWDDCSRYGLLAAGGDPKWSNPVLNFTEGDVVVAYLKRERNVGGYVGVGAVLARAVPYARYLHQGRLLSDFDLAEPNLAHDSGDMAVCEYIVRVKWVNAVRREQAKWQSNAGLFTSSPSQSTVGV